MNIIFFLKRCNLNKIKNDGSTWNPGGSVSGSRERHKEEDDCSDCGSDSGPERGPIRIRVGDLAEKKTKERITRAEIARDLESSP